MKRQGNEIVGMQKALRRLVLKFKQRRKPETVGQVLFVNGYNRAVQDIANFFYSTHRDQKEAKP